MLSQAEVGVFFVINNKKIAKLLGIATAASLVFTGCNTPSSIFGFNLEEPISCLYGPAPVIDEEKDTDVKPVLDEKIDEEPIILLYGPAIDDPELPQPEEVYPLLYGPMVIEDPPITQDPKLENSDKVENPIDVVYGPASWYEE